MRLIILGSLPPASVATDLLAHVQEHCPALIEMMQRLVASEEQCPPEETGCTSTEFLELKEMGFVPQPEMNPSAGWGPLRTGMISPSEKVWIADLCSVAIGREGAQLIHPEALSLTSDEANALFDAVRPLWEHCAISVLPIETGRWRIWLPSDARMRSITPEAVALLSVSDWWPQDPSMQTWRKLLNEIQMVWHSHPVNEMRAQRGLHPVNSLWLYGGACGWKPAKPSDPPLFYHGLTKSFLDSDWATWINQLPALSEFISAKTAVSSLTLLGERRIVTLTPPQRRWWQAFLPQRTQNWMNWWTRQN